MQASGPLGDADRPTEPRGRHARIRADHLEVLERPSRPSAGAGSEVAGPSAARGTVSAAMERESCSRTHSTSGLVRGRPATTTVGTVSLPSLAALTAAAPAGSRQMLTQCNWRALRPSRIRSRMQYLQPGRQ